MLFDQVSSDLLLHLIHSAPGDERLMQCLVREAAGRLHECSGQEVLDLIESISTGRCRPWLQPARCHGRSPFIIGFQVESS